MTDPARNSDWVQTTLSILGGTVCWLLYTLISLWVAGAVYVDGPLGMKAGNDWLAIGWLVVAIGCLVFIRKPWKRALVWSVWVLVVLVPWIGIAPSNDREWKPDWAETGWVDFEDGTLRFHNFRNFDYDADGGVTERWETSRGFDRAWR